MKRKKDRTLFSLISRYAPVFFMLLLVCAVPFNIVYHFNSKYAYVDGYFVNHLDFVVHIVDIAVVLLIAFFFLKGGVLRARSAKLAVVLIALFWVIQVGVFRDVIVVYEATRIAGYALCLVGLVSYFRGAGAKSVKLMKSRLWGWRVREIVVAGIIISGVVQVIIALLQFHSGHMLGIDFLGESVVQVGGAGASSVYLPGGYHLRAYGTFPHPNVLGGFLVVCLAAAVHEFFMKKGVWRVAILVAGIGILYGIFVSWSRMAWLATALVICVLSAKFVYEHGRKRFMIFCGVACVSVILCGGLILWGNDSVSRAVRERLVTQSSGSDVSVTERKELASRAWDIIDEHQAMGTGAGTFVRELADYPVVTPRGLRVMQPVHSVPLLMLSEVGIIGCVLLGLAAGVMLWKETISVKGILIVGTIVLLGLMDHYLWSLPQGMGISLVAAVWYFMKV